MDRLRLKVSPLATLHAVPVLIGGLLAVHLLLSPALHPLQRAGRQAPARRPSDPVAALLCALVLDTAAFDGTRLAAYRGHDCRPSKIAANLRGTS